MRIARNHRVSSVALTALGLGLAIAQSAGFAVSILADPCAQACAEDGPDGRCPHTCNQCVCCPHPLPGLVAAAVVLPQPERASAAVAGDAPVLVSALQREILHVPKPLSA